jgi:hypothetical protein
MELKRVKPTSLIQRENNTGLLPDYYEEEDRTNDALRQRRQKLAEKRLHLFPDSEDTDYGDFNAR